MSKKMPSLDKAYPRKNLYWNPSDDVLLDHIARAYKREMQLAGIQPYQDGNEREPNASKIVHFLILLASGRIDGMAISRTSEPTEKPD